MRPLASAFAAVLVTAMAACGQSGDGGVRSEETRAPAKRVSSETCEGLRAINLAREASALAPVACDGALTRMALNHARYLVQNGAPEGADRHAEESGLPLYSGRTLRERAAAAGVAHEGYWISENVGGDARDADAAVDAHLATVFHRSPLMTPGAVALGYAVAEEDTVVMTSLALADAPVEFPVGLHPAPGASAVPRSFSALRERPDPVPDVAAPGYPISVHFPRRRLPTGKEPTLVIEQFTLSRAGKPIATRMLTPSVDARLFGSDAYLVPLAPLPVGSYEATVRASYGRAAVARTWSFSVAD